jgi:two-component system response regulator YesN
MKFIAVLDSTFVVRNRIKELVAQAEIEVIEASKPEQLVNLLKAPNDIGLIITELEFSQEDGLAILTKIMACAGEIPVMILTAEKRRSFFVKGVQMGVMDYILKPFDGEHFFKRVIDLMKLERDGLAISIVGEINQEIPILNLDFDSYLDKELMKANKGKYPISIMRLKLIDTENKTNKQQKENFRTMFFSFS